MVVSQLVAVEKFISIYQKCLKVLDSNEVSCYNRLVSALLHL